MSLLSLSLRISLCAIVMSVLASCASFPDQNVATPDRARTPLALASMALDRVLEDRILALDPENVSGADVRDTLSKAPAPRIVLLHGGVFPVHLAMSSFAQFLVGMGYPEERVRVPGPSGDWSHNPYLPSNRVAGLIAWSYEQEAMRPMLIGHSQGGIQVVKILNDLAGTYSREVHVWNPLTGNPERRTTIIDPLTGKERPVVGVQVSFASAVGAGGPSFIFPNNWEVLGRLRDIPDTAVQFNGYFIGIDWFVVNFGGPGADRFKPLGTAQIRNVELPAGYLHVTVPVSHHLPANQEFKRFIDAYRGTTEKPDEATMPGSYSDNIYYAADNWFTIKKHWVLELKRMINARRALFPTR
ncbi:MAG TPA: hypothetical protein VNG69_16080 [Casimicrobiaceae bacterium]|nr:hypothetical protein [Casimicrobiaceae bacterium]